jgi:PadR family transcriptional regulator, regulatory protein AphA
MEIKYAILGFLSWRPASGYDLKKLMADSIPYYWSGNNNQIYTALTALHKEGLVTNYVMHQERYPARKIYSITEEGLAALKNWLASPPELPLLRNSFLVQLAWADQLAAADLENLFSAYESEVNSQLLILREQARRGILINPARTPREKLLWEGISENHTAFYENELKWIRGMKEKLKQE